MENLLTQVESIVAEFLDCGVSSFEIPAGGRIAETYILELDDEPWHAVCKIGGPSVRTGDVIEPLAIRLVDSITDLPVPHVFASGVFTGVSGHNKYWALYEFCDGSQPVPFDSLAVSADDPRASLRIVFALDTAMNVQHCQGLCICQCCRFDRLHRPILPKRLLSPQLTVVGIQTLSAQ
jgi:hypothetical protein